MASVSVVIPTYNAIGQVEPLLNQLEKLQASSFKLQGRPEGAPQAPRDNSENLEAASWKLEAEVIIADDASRDGTGARLTEQYPWLTVVAGETNVGFGANVMRGVQRASGDYLFLLNSDVELCGDPITPLVELLESDDSIFAAMPLIYNTHLGMVENLARLYCHRGLCWHTELTEQAQWTEVVRKLIVGGAGTFACENWQTGVSAPPVSAVLCGAAFLCRRERFLQLGGFDPRYKPFYWEDVALGFAAARRSWRTVTLPQSLVIHRHSESISAKVGERKLRYLILNQLRFVHQFRGDMHSLGLKNERLWWLARSMRALTKADLMFAWEYLKAAMF